MKKPTRSLLAIAALATTVAAGAQQALQPAPDYTLSANLGVARYADADKGYYVSPANGKYLGKAAGVVGVKYTHNF